jgi:hypothetical protein
LLLLLAAVSSAKAHAEQLASPPSVAPHKAKARWQLLVWKPRNGTVELVRKPRPVVEIARGELWGVK